MTGTTAVNIDTADKLAAALPRYLAVVVGLALILLMLVFRSILVPLKAAGGFLLTIAAVVRRRRRGLPVGHLADLFGVSNPARSSASCRSCSSAILFGLAMDYEVFLVSRMREDFVHGARPREAIVTGFGHSARVVVAAALIMIGVFGGFVLDDDPIIKSIGFALAFGVLVDAFVVRMTLVPAVMALLGTPRLVAAELAGPAPAQRRHRGREAPPGPQPSSRADLRDRAVGDTQDAGAADGRAGVAF